MENFIFCAVTFLDVVDHGGVIERRYNYFFSRDFYLFDVILILINSRARSNRNKRAWFQDNFLHFEIFGIFGNF